MKIKLTDDEILMAKEFAEKRNHTARNWAPTYTGLKTKNANLVGCLGEVACHKLFRKMEVRFRYIATNCGADDCDFVVWSKKTGDPVKVDLKTRGSEEQELFLMPKAQWDGHPCALYLSARIIPRVDEVEAVEFCGWMSRKRAGEILWDAPNYQTETLAVEFKELSQMYTFWSKVQTVGEII